jgi:hypothetical protein
VTVSLYTCIVGDMTSTNLIPNLTSFAAWKRHIQPGMIVRVTNRIRPEADRLARIETVQTNAFSTWAIKADGTLVESWHYYSKASSYRVEGATLDFCPGEAGYSYTLVGEIDGFDQCRMMGEK